MTTTFAQSFAFSVRPDTDPTGTDTFGLTANMTGSSLAEGDQQFFTRTFYPENIDNNSVGGSGSDLDGFSFGNFPALANTANGGTVAQLDWGGEALVMATLKSIAIEIKTKEAFTLTFSTGTLTSTGVEVTDGDTVTIGGVTYRFKTTMAAINDVKRNGTAATTLTNLLAAINGTGTPGVEYYAGTLIHPSVIASDPTPTTLTLTAISQFARVAATGTLTGTATNVTDGDTVTIGSTVYRFKGTMALAYDVQIGGSAAASLANLLAAINASGTPGTEYYAGTLIHPSVYAASPTSTTIRVTAITSGTIGNNIATTETAAELSFGAVTLTGGAATASSNTIATVSSNAGATPPANTLSFTAATLLGGGEVESPAVARGLEGTVRALMDGNLFPGTSSIDFTASDPCMMTFTMPEGWTPGGSGALTLVFTPDGAAPLGPTDVNAVVTLTLVGNAA